MSRFFRLFKVFVPGTVTLGAHATALGHNPVPYASTISEEQGTHLTTYKENIQDPLEETPDVHERPHEWPRLGSSFYDEFEKTMSSQEATTKQAHMAKDFSHYPTNLYISDQELMKYVEHTQLLPTTSKQDISNLCKTAIKQKFYSVCVTPVWVKYCSKLLSNSHTKVCSVIGYPLGTNSTQIKVLEAIQTVQDGADEIDMVVATGYIKSNDFTEIEFDVASVVQAVNGKLDEKNNGNDKYNFSKKYKSKTIVKVIIETESLTNDEIIKTCESCIRGGCDYIKIGHSNDLKLIELIKTTINNECKKMGKPIGSVGIKADVVGINSNTLAKKLIKAGVSRIGMYNQ